MPNFIEMLRQAHEDGGGDAERSDRSPLAPDIEAIRLRDSLAALHTKHEFRVGMIVRQKPQARNYRPFGDNDLAIVVKVFNAEPIYERGTYGSNQFHMSLDLVVGSIECPTDGDDQFCLYYVQSDRFEPVEDPS